MILLHRLRVRGLRNLRSVDMQLCSAITVLQGGNGAGKTAILEAVYLLSRGRSFRGRRLGPLVTYGERSACVEGWLERGGAIERIHWENHRPAGPGEGTGYSKEGQGSSRRRPFLVRLVCDATPALVEGEPSMRRRFVDWNLFHVEPRFGEWRAGFRRVASQRNAWLRAGARGPAVWDRAYAEGMAQIEAARQGFADLLSDSFSTLTADIEWFQGLRLEWRSGLGNVEENLSRLEDARATDRRRGFTALGLSRDDLAITADGHRWAGSRGEAKIVGVLLQLAAQRIVDSQSALPALWLVDDLSAELADASSDRLLGIISAEAPQLIATALPGRVFQSVGSLFHVEQGIVHGYSPPAATRATRHRPSL